MALQALSQSFDGRQDERGPTLNGFDNICTDSLFMAESSMNMVSVSHDGAQNLSSEKSENPGKCVSVKLSCFVTQ